MIQWNFASIKLYYFLIFLFILRIICLPWEHFPVESQNGVATGQSASSRHVSKLKFDNNKESCTAALHAPATAVTWWHLKQKKMHLKTSSNEAAAASNNYNSSCWWLLIHHRNIHECTMQKRGLLVDSCTDRRYSAPTPRISLFFARQYWLLFHALF